MILPGWFDHLGHSFSNLILTFLKKLGSSISINSFSSLWSLEAYGVCSLISGGLCLRCLKLWNLCMIATLFTEIWRYAIFLNEVLYNSSFELSQWTQNSFHKFPSLFSNNGNKDLIGCSQCTMDFLSCQRESMHKNVLSLPGICFLFFFAKVMFNSLWLFLL